MTTTPETVWEYTENPPKYAETVAELWSWSLNYDRLDPNNPWWLFLDLVGWTADHYGERVSAFTYTIDTLDRLGRRGAHFGLGWKECDLLGRALVEYSDHPHDLDQWIAGLMECEG